MKKFFKYFAFGFLVFLIYIVIDTYPQLDLISGFSAKSVASGHFIDGRSLETIQQGDNDIPKVDWATNEINQGEKFVTSTVHGLKERKAIYREGLGSTLINDDFDVSKPYEVPKRAKLNTNLPYPYGNVKPKDTVFANIDWCGGAGDCHDGHQTVASRDCAFRAARRHHRRVCVTMEFVDFSPRLSTD